MHLVIGWLDICVDVQLTYQKKGHSYLSFNHKSINYIKKIRPVQGFLFYQAVWVLVNTTGAGQR